MKIIDSQFRAAKVEGKVEENVEENVCVCGGDGTCNKCNGHCDNCNDAAPKIDEDDKKSIISAQSNATHVIGDKQKCGPHNTVKCQECDKKCAGSKCDEKCGGVNCEGKCVGAKCENKRAQFDTISCHSDESCIIGKESNKQPDHFINQHDMTRITSLIAKHNIGGLSKQFGKVISDTIEKNQERITFKDPQNGEETTIQETKLPHGVSAHIRQEKVEEDYTKEDFNKNGNHIEQKSFKIVAPNFQEEIQEVFEYEEGDKSGNNENKEGDQSENTSIKSENEDVQENNENKDFQENNENKDVQEDGSIKIGSPAYINQMFMYTYQPPKQQKKTNQVPPPTSNFKQNIINGLGVGGILLGCTMDHQGQDQNQNEEQQAEPVEPTESQVEPAESQVEQAGS